MVYIPAEDFRRGGEQFEPNHRLKLYISPPKSVGHQAESAQLFLDIPYRSACERKHFNDHYHPVGMSAWDN